MKHLIAAAFQNRTQRSLIIFTLVMMVFLTFASQMEIVSLGIITKKGPDFFELFAPVKEGHLVKGDVVSRELFESRWNEIATDQSISREDTIRFMTHYKSDDLIQRVINTLDQIFPVAGNIKNLIILIICIAIFKAITLFSHRMATKLVSIHVSRDLRQKYFEHIQLQPMQFFQKYQMGSLSSRIVSDTTLIAEAVNSWIVNYLQTPFTAITTLTLCFLTSWRLSLIVFVGFPIILFPIAYIAKNIRRISRQIQLNQEKFTSTLIEFLSGIQTIKVFGMEPFSLRKYREQNDKMAYLETKAARYDVSSRPIVHTIAMLFLSSTLLYGLYGLRMSVSETFFYAGLLYVFYEPIKKFAEENGRIEKGIAALDRMQEVLNIQPEIQDQPDATPLTQFQSEIKFQNVNFQYETTPILRNFNLTIRKGETIAFVGPTGAGKSTIVQLLPRLYDIQEGEITIDGKSIKTYTQKSLRDQIAFVPQKPFLFLDTISANIAYGKTFTKEEIISAARKAHAEEFIQELPNQYETELQETGKNLSGGQQQRLAIARALVKKAPILVMDEATSSLDNLSELKIQQAIQELKGEMTQIIIAHRLSTITHADRIVYIEHGEKVAEGSWEELMESCPGFRAMVKRTEESS